MIATTISNDLAPEAKKRLLSDADDHLGVDTMGEPGQDPSPFLPEIKHIAQTKRMSTAVAKGWIKAFQKEVKGILINRAACKIEEPNEDDTVIPVKDVHKCKIDKEGMIDKLKTRIAH